MVREPDATMQPTLQDHQLMSKQRVLSLKPQLRLEWRGQDGQNETEQPDHSASLGDSITASTRIRFSVHTPVGNGLHKGRRRNYRYQRAASPESPTIFGSTRTRASRTPRTGDSQGRSCRSRISYVAPGRC